MAIVYIYYGLSGVCNELGEACRPSKATVAGVAPHIYAVRTIRVSTSNEMLDRCIRYCYIRTCRALNMQTPMCTDTTFY